MPTHYDPLKFDQNPLSHFGEYSGEILGVLGLGADRQIAKNSKNM